MKRIGLAIALFLGAMAVWVLLGNGIALILR